MLGIILIYYLGKQFYTLAEEYDRSKWGYGIAGVLSYYAATFAFLLILIFGLGAYDPTIIDGIPDIALDLIGIPFGLFGAWLFYRFLKRKFEHDFAPTVQDDDLLDDNLL